MVRAGLADYRRRYAVASNAQPVVAADMADDPHTITESDVTVTATVYAREFASYDTDGNATFTWTTLLTGKALAYHRRSEISHDPSWVKVDGMLTVADPDGDAQAISESTEVAIEIDGVTEVWNVVTADWLPGRVELVLVRYESNDE